jgi:hypothetical protein
MKFKKSYLKKSKEELEQWLNINKRFSRIPDKTKYNRKRKHRKDNLSDE